MGIAGSKLSRRWDGVRKIRKIVLKTMSSSGIWMYEIFMISRTDVVNQTGRSMCHNVWFRVSGRLCSVQSGYVQKSRRSNFSRGCCYDNSLFLKWRCPLPRLDAIMRGHKNYTDSDCFDFIIGFHCQEYKHPSPPSRIFESKQYFHLQKNSIFILKCHIINRKRKLFQFRTPWLPKTLMTMPMIIYLLIF